MRAEPGATPTPFWENDDGQLWFRGVRVKSFRIDADNQRHLLQAFQLRRWRRPLDNRFYTKKGCTDPKTALHKAIERLNQVTRPFGLRFRGTAAGLVGWVEEA